MVSGQPSGSPGSGGRGVWWGGSLVGGGHLRGTGLPDTRTSGLPDQSTPITLPAMPEQPVPTDDQLIPRAQDGDIAAFGALVDQHQSLVRGWFRVRLGDWASADDLAQEVFVTAFRRIRTYTGEGAFAGWLVGIARNHLRNHLRKHHVEVVGGSEELAGLIDHGVALCFAGRDEGHLVEALRACLEPLGDHARDLLEQRYVTGRTVRDIAAASGRGYSALTMQLHRLREVLAECITTRVAADGGVRP